VLRIFISFLLYCLIFGSCKAKLSVRDRALQFCRQSKIKYCNSTVVLIPSVGCGTCISSAIDFLKRNSIDEKYQFVFVQIDDKKMVKSWLKNCNNRGNVRLDTAALFRMHGFASEYPVVMLTNECEISDVIIVNTKNMSIWEKL
jgi:peroxiredoxin